MNNKDSIKENRLRYYRKLCGFEIPYVAKRLGISEKRISNWENGITLPSTAGAISIAILYRVTLEKVYPILFKKAAQELKSHSRRETPPKSKGTTQPKPTS